MTIMITGVNDMLVASGNTVVALEDVPLVINRDSSVPAMRRATACSR